MRKILSLCVVALLSASMWAADYWYSGSTNGWTPEAMSSSAHGVYKYVAISQQSEAVNFKIQTIKDDWDTALGRDYNVPGFANTNITDMNSSSNTWDTPNSNCALYHVSSAFYIIVFEPNKENSFNTTENPIICASSTLPAEYPDSTTYYFVNVPGWDAVYAYCYTDGDNHGKTWPGDAAIKTGEKHNDYDIWSVKTPDAHPYIIFSNNDGVQTADLTKDTDKPYFYPERLNGSNHYETKWYTYATLPGETTVYFVNSKGWSFANAYAYKISQDVNDYAKAWPGLSMTKTEQKVNDYDIYKVSFSSYFNGVIFNNKIGDSGEQLERFVTDAAKPYYYEGTLYASREDIPAPTTSVEHTYDDVQCTKLLRNGQILILRGEKVYTLTGQEVR